MFNKEEYTKQKQRVEKGITEMIESYCNKNYFTIRNKALIYIIENIDDECNSDVVEEIINGEIPDNLIDFDNPNTYLLINERVLEDVHFIACCVNEIIRIYENEFYI